jgi:acyl-CoA hydrolase
MTTSDGVNFSKIASDASIEKAVAALKASGINALVASSGAEAKQMALDLVPAGSEVMTMTSVTLETIGVAQEINESGKWTPIRSQFPKLDPSQKRKYSAGPDYALGSVHAVTEDGKVVIASNTGSQLPAYAYGAGQVIWVVGGQKVVADLDTAMKRIYEYVLPLEAVRANKAYNITTGSNVSKMLIINREVNPKRLTLIIVKEALGF